MSKYGMHPAIPATIAPELAEATKASAAGTRPILPVEPQLEDCCGSGCVVCVFDAYEMARERYAVKLAAWVAAHPVPPEPTPPARESSP